MREFKWNEAEVKHIERIRSLLQLMLPSPPCDWTTQQAVRAVETIEAAAAELRGEVRTRLHAESEEG